MQTPAKIGKRATVVTFRRDSDSSDTSDSESGCNRKTERVPPSHVAARHCWPRTCQAALGRVSLALVLLTACVQVTPSKYDPDRCAINLSCDLDVDGEIAVEVGGNDCNDDDELLQYSTEAWRDADGDGYGNAAQQASVCGTTEGYVANSLDCDDQDSASYPGGNEVCNDGLDQDCDGGAGSCDWPADLTLEQDSFILSGITEGDRLGETIAIGFLDNDRFPDLAVGLPRDATNGAGAGAVYVFLGPFDSAASLEDADFVYFGPEGSGAGTALAVGELDGREGGSDELVIGAPYATGFDETPSSGAVYVLQGPLWGSDVLPSGAQGDGIVRISGSSFGTNAGLSLSTGNVIGDETGDLLIGGSGPDSLDARGGAWLFRGPIEPTFDQFEDLDLENADFQFRGQKNDQIGTVLAVNGLVALGAWGAAGGLGGVYLLAPTETDGPVIELSQETDSLLAGEGVDSFAGFSLARGDITGDGLEDLLVGSPSYNGGRGAVYGVFDLTSPPETFSEALKLEAGDNLTQEDGLFGYSITVLPHFDDSGGAVVAIGAPGNGDPEQPAGAVYLFSLQMTNGAATQGALIGRVEGAAAGESAGASLATLGDEDGDGWSELLIGAPGPEILSQVIGRVHKLEGRGK